MKLKSLTILIVSLAPFTMSGQTNIKKAFERFLENPAVTYTENHSLSKDTGKGIKQSQSDIYNFTVNSIQFKLINNILQAFNKDKENAYSLSSGIYKKNDPNVSLAVGNGNGSGVLLTTELGVNYQYALFLAPKNEDSSGNYRYAYAITWKKEKDKITGMLITTYATTLSYRQSQSSGSKFNGTIYYNNTPYYSVNNGDSVNGSKNKSKSSVKYGGSWFEKFMQEAKKLSIFDDNGIVLQNVVTQIYEITKKVDQYDNVSTQEKQLARDILQEYINKSKDTVCRRILRSAQDNLK